MTVSLPLLGERGWVANGTVRAIPLTVRLAVLVGVRLMELRVHLIVNVCRVHVVVATVVIIKADPLDAQIVTAMVIVADVVQITICRRVLVKN